MFVHIGNHYLNLATVQGVDYPVRAAHPDPKVRLAAVESRKKTEGASAPAASPDKPVDVFVNDAARIRYIGDGTAPDYLFGEDALNLVLALDELCKRRPTAAPPDKVAKAS